MFVSPYSFYARGLKPPCDHVELYNCLSHNSNKCNPYAGTNNYHCLGFPSRSKHSVCRPLGLPAPVFRSPGLRPSGNPLMKHCQAAVCLSTKCELRLSWISFLLKALRLSPFGLVGVGFSHPGTPPVRKSAA